MANVSWIQQTGELGNKLIRNPAQRLGYAEKRAATMAGKMAGKTRQGIQLPPEIGALRPSDALNSMMRVGTRIMPYVVKGLQVKQGFDLANAALRKVDNGHDWMHPRQAY